MLRTPYGACTRPSRYHRVITCDPSRASVRDIAQLDTVTGGVGEYYVRHCIGQGRQAW